MTALVVLLAAVSTSAMASDVLRTGRIKLAEGDLVDLDKGLVTQQYGTEGLDFSLDKDPDDQANLGDISTLAALGPGDQTERDFLGCDATEFTAEGLPLKTLAAGGYVCFRTNQGRLGLLKVDALTPDSISFEYTIWKDKPTVAALPARIGDCVKTKISEKTTRLEGAADSGSAVLFANGGYQVSYDIEPAIKRSKVGDPVQMCLISTPEECPVGDDRGHVYKTTNLRTKQSWTLSDSEHSCGGA